MVGISLMALAVKSLIGFLTQLSPLLPIPLVLVLECWAVSKCEFSRGWAFVFRLAYVTSILFATFATYILGMIVWD